MSDKKILYLEDEHYLGRIVKESLSSRGYDVKLVTNGEEALKYFKIFEPDICVLDVMVPMIDGFEVGKKIVSLNSDIPIIYLTAKVQSEDVLQGFKSGGNDYIRKPFSMEELIVRIENLFQLKKSSVKNETQTQLNCGKYLFVPDKFQLKYEDSITDLTYRENELLKMLITNKNTVIDRKNILMKIWGDDSYYNSRNLDVYMRKIRIYLQQDKNIELKTLRGVGYFLKVVD